MGKNSDNTVTTTPETTSAPATNTTAVNGATAPETTTAPETAPETTSAPTRGRAAKPAGYVPGKDDSVYADGTVVIGGKKKEAVIIPKEPGIKAQLDVYAKANGHNALIQRGKRVMVPRPLAEVIKESQKRAEKADAYYYANSN